MKIVTGLRFIDRNQKRILQQQLADIEINPEESTVSISGDTAAWEDVPMEENGGRHVATA